MLAEVSEFSERATTTEYFALQSAVVADVVPMYLYVAALACSFHVEPAAIAAYFALSPPTEGMIAAKDAVFTLKS
jgi:hypothetical protein